MKCPYIEERLSDYMEHSLPADDMERVAEHLHQCGNCSALEEDVRSVLAICKSLPMYEPATALVEKILLRTSGRPRTRSKRELLDQYFFRPLFTPRFAAGAGLVVLFLALFLNLMLPHVSGMAASLSPGELLRKVDRGVQEIYGGGLRLYDKKNEWQAQLSFFKNNIFNKLGFMIEGLQIPDEADKKPGEPQQQLEKVPSKKVASCCCEPGPHFSPALCCGECGLAGANQRRA